MGQSFDFRGCAALQTGPVVVEPLLEAGEVETAVVDHNPQLGWKTEERKDLTNAKSLQACQDLAVSIEVDWLGEKSLSVWLATCDEVIRRVDDGQGAFSGTPTETLGAKATQPRRRPMSPGRDTAKLSWLTVTYHLYDDVYLAYCIVSYCRGSRALLFQKRQPKEGTIEGDLACSVLSSDVQ